MQLFFQWYFHMIVHFSLIEILFYICDGCITILQQVEKSQTETQVDIEIQLVITCLFWCAAATCIHKIKNTAPTKI